MELSSTRQLQVKGFTYRRIAEITGQTIEQVMEQLSTPAKVRGQHKEPESFARRREADEAFAASLGVHISYDDLEPMARWA
jgi:hypothetical protein